MTERIRVDFTKTGKLVRHGTVGAYTNHGCKCPKCTTAFSDHNREYKHRTGRCRPREVVNRERFDAVEHGGHTKYHEHRCRCEVCKEGERVRRSATRARARARPIPAHVHGTINGYTNYACRCEECRAAQRIRDRGRRRLDTVIR